MIIETRDKWILDADLRPVPCADLLRWARWFETANCHVADTTIGGVRVSTVFLGLNHQFDPNRAPLLFETMIFGGPLDGEMDRYSTWREAERGHAHFCNAVREAQALIRKRFLLVIIALAIIATLGCLCVLLFK